MDKGRCGERANQQRVYPYALPPDGDLCFFLSWKLGPIAELHKLSCLCILDIWRLSLDLVVHIFFCFWVAMSTNHGLQNLVKERGTGP